MTRLGLVLTLFMTSCLGSDAEVCQEVNGSQEQFGLHLPNDFTVDIEAVLQESDSVQNLRLYYSRRHHMIRLDMLESQVSSSLYFYFQENEILVFNFMVGRGDCSVIPDIVESVNSFWFGGLEPTRGTPQIPAPLAVLHFMGPSGFGADQIVTKYQGIKRVRGKMAKAFTSCQSWTGPRSDVTLNVTHYFADERYRFPSGNVSTLLAIEVEGVGNWRGVTNTSIRHAYNYFNFRSIIEDESVLETPDGIVCSGRKALKQLPRLPDHVQFTSETVDYVNNVYLTSQESYSYRDQYAVTRTKTVDGWSRAIDPVTTVMDFVTDQMYVMNSAKSLCRKLDIRNASQSELPLYSLDGGKVVMANPRKFFFADDKDFSYLGKKKVRGMLTDVFVAQTKDLLHYPEAVVQWHFAPPVRSWNDEDPDYIKHQWPMPVKFKFWPYSEYDKAITQNIFHADYNHAWVDDYDVAPCFNNTRDFQLAFKGTRQDIVATGEERFKQEATLRIAHTANIRPIKVHQMELFYDDREVFLEFSISDDSTLQVETQRVLEAVQAGALSLNLTDSRTRTKKTVRIHKMASAPAKKPHVIVDRAGGGGDEGHTAGAMAGVGIAMILAGIIGGVATGFLHTR